MALQIAKRHEKRAGTVMVTSENMIGHGAGWGIPIATLTLNFRIGGIIDRLVAENHLIVAKQHLRLSLGFDHHIIDGAPAAKVVRNLKKLIICGAVKN